MGEQAISHIVWSSIKLGFNPNEHVPGMVDTLTNIYLQLMRATNKRQRPSEQGAAILKRSVLWALATMQHPAATSELIEAVFSFLANLMQHPNVQQRPTAQAVSNVALALAELQHSLKNDRLLHDFCKYMHSLLQIPDVRGHLNAQNVANVIWALAKLQLSLEDRLLDDLCMYMHSLHESPPESRSAEHSTTQNVASALWALARMKRASPGEVVPAMLDHLVALCHASGLQLQSQCISNCFLSCAELRLSLHPSQFEVLLKHFVRAACDQV